jgi:hypothetical protein
MPNKSRKSRLKYKRQGNPTSLAVKESGQSPQPLPALSKQAPPTKSQVATDELAIRHQYVRSDLKRTFIIGGAMFALLFILYFILR